MSKNIAIVIPSLKGGGAERVAGYLSQHLSDEYNVYLLLEDTNNSVYDNGGEIIKIDATKTESELLYYKKHLDIDCTISFLDKYNLANVKTRLNDRIIISQRSTLTKYQTFAASPNSRYAMLFREADNIVACAYGVKEDLIEKLGIDGDMISVIYNFADFQKYLELAENNEPEDFSDDISKTKYILNVGRLTEAKNQIMLVRQFAIFHKLYDSELKLIILGSGKLEQMLREEIAINDMKNYIHIFPYVSNPFRYYKNATFSVLSSRWEGLPNVITESMTFQKPVVATDCMSGPRELLDDKREYHSAIKGYEIAKRGVLVENTEAEFSGGTHFFADAINLMNTNFKMYGKMQRNISEYVENYDNHELLAQWKRLIESDSANAKRSNYMDNKKIIESAPIVIVYGAGKIGKKVMDNIRTKERAFCCYAVTDNVDDRSIDGIEVKRLDELTAYKENAVLLIASTSGSYPDEMCIYANKLGFKRIMFPVI